MLYIQRENRHQITFPQSINEYISDENPVRVVDAFVNSLNLDDLGFLHHTPGKVGRQGYDPVHLSTEVQ